MGQLAASIAHEVNQPITATVTNANAAVRWLSAKPPALDEVGLGLIIKDADRAAQVHTTLAEGLPQVLVDRAELQQVLLNLILNALEAMIEVEGVRKLQISTALDQEDVRVTVADSGPGFVVENVEQVFEPFYTTKATGLGMGLSICRSIIDSHGGRFWASPKQSPGAQVQFTLPALLVDSGQ